MSERGEFLVRFWGVRGSYPVPGPSTAQYGGNTPCVEVQVNGQRIILDAGTGIIGLGKKLMGEFAAGRGEGKISVVLLISHTHYDHIQGLPFFLPAHSGEGILHIFGPAAMTGEFGDALTRAMLPAYSPLCLDELRSTKVIRSLQESHVVLLGPEDSEPRVLEAVRDQTQLPAGHVLIRAMRSYSHPKGGTYVFRVEAEGKSVVYATDTEGYVGGDARLIAFARGTNLLIHDAQYTTSEYLDPQAPKQGYGHSTVDMAVDVAKAAGAQQLVLFHHDPDHDDNAVREMEAYARRLFPATDAAREGSVYRL
ncbi:MAG: MBL fold metallo-hydrolase [candidate division KSB1 bacterium]|nr:MBL fold metallo-hydrolase [candidate division KSB1 bacterium]